MFDFANSGYSTVVSTAVYNAYFVSHIAGGAGGFNSGTATFLWTIAVGISNALIVATAPILGAIADYSAAKKRLLAATTIACIVCTAMLSLPAPGQVALAMLLVICSNFTFGTGEDLIAAFLPEISPKENMGRVSAFGWTVGYMGGLLVLALSLGYVSWAQRQGLPEHQFVSVTLLIVAAIFALAASPTFLWLRERANPQKLPAGKNYVQVGFERFRETLEHAHHFQDLFRFLLTLIAYSCGTSTVVVLAAVYAEQVMGFTTSETLMLIILVNITAAIGAYAFGHIQDRLGSVPTLKITLLIWVTATLLTAFTHSKAEFWLVANLFGIAMGSSQSAGRALVGQFSPPERSAEFFGLWGLSVKLASVVGPMTYGLIDYLTSGNHRIAIMSTASFFVIGLLLLATVDEQRGKQAAQALSR